MYNLAALYISSLELAYYKPEKHRHSKNFLYKIVYIKLKTIFFTTYLLFFVCPFILEP
jgi:hypothetical protein